MTDPGQPPFILPEGGSPPPPPPPPGYGYGPPPGYPNHPYGGPPYGWDGPPGRIRHTGISILLFICTLSIYAFVYNFSVHSEMRRHSGRGIGGGVALLLTFVANVAMPFVTAAEVGSLYSRRGEAQPVSGWTGLWFVLPSLGGNLSGFGFFFILLFLIPFASGPDAGFVAVLAIWLIAIVIGAAIWFVKTNGALNDYWASLGVTADGRYV